MADESAIEYKAVLVIVNTLAIMVEENGFREKLLSNGVIITKAEIFGNMTVTVKYTCKSNNKLFGDEAVSYQFNSGKEDWPTSLDLILKHL